MKDTFENFLRAGYAYSFEQGPNKVRSHEDARVNGLNCVALAHLAMKDLFDYTLPEDYQCLELFLDREQHFESIDSLDSAQQGDLVWFGFAEPRIPLEEFVPVYDECREITNWQDVAVRHVGLFTGEIDGEGDQLVLHATRSAGTVAIWPLRKFQEYKRYRKVYGVSRLKGQS